MPPGDVQVTTPFVYSTLVAAVDTLPVAVIAHRRRLVFFYHARMVRAGATKSALWSGIYMLMHAPYSATTGGQ